MGDGVEAGSPNTLVGRLRIILQVRMVRNPNGRRYRSTQTISMRGGGSKGVRTQVVATAGGNAGWTILDKIEAKSNVR